MEYIVPLQDTWWVCSTGLTPCVHIHILRTTSKYCILVRLIPKVIYHEADFLAPGSTAPFLRTNRGPFTTLTLPILLGGRVDKIRYNDCSLGHPTQQVGYWSLCKSIDKDIQHLESSVSSLEASLDSLVEVILQSRGGQICYFFSIRAYAWPQAKNASSMPINQG